MRRPLKSWKLQRLTLSEWSEGNMSKKCVNIEAEPSAWAFGRWGLMPSTNNNEACWHVIPVTTDTEELLIKHPHMLSPSCKCSPKDHVSGKGWHVFIHDDSINMLAQPYRGYIQTCVQLAQAIWRSEKKIPFDPASGISLTKRDISDLEDGAK